MNAILIEHSPRLILLTLLTLLTLFLLTDKRC